MSTKGINYVKYNSLPIKIRMKIVQLVLNELGYSIEVSGIRDKKTIKAIMDFQKNHGLAQNAVICNRTYDAMDIFNITRTWGDLSDKIGKHI